MHSAKAEVETSVAPGISRARSYVTRRDRIAPPSPRVIAVATSSHPSSSNIIAPDRITLPGLTLSCPAYFGAVPRVEYGVPVAHVAARREPEPAHLRRRGVREQIAVQVGCGDHRVLLGTEHELREHRIRNPVLDDHLSRVPFPVSRVCLADGLLAEPRFRHLVPPLPEPALRELHDVALVHERDRAAAGAQRVLDGFHD